MRGSLGRRWLAASLLGGCLVPPPADDPGSTTSGATTGSTASRADASGAGAGTTEADSTTADAVTTAETTGGTAADTTAGTVTEDGTDTTGTSTGRAGEPCADAANVVYLNFDEITLTLGRVDDAPLDVTGLRQQEGAWPAYAAGDAEEVVAQVQVHWLAYDVCLTTQRPVSPNAIYDMLVVRSVPFPGAGGVLAVSAADCGDANDNEVAIVFLDETLGLSETTKAIVLSSIIGRRFGLDSVDGTEDLMHVFPSQTAPDATFTDACIDLSAGSDCTGTAQCPPGQQNAHAHLLTTVGGG